MRGLFITGTDTNVGKTWVTCGLIRELSAQGRNVAACKPVCTGSEETDEGIRRWGDVERLYDSLNGSFPRERICPLRFDAPLAPPVSAALEGREIDDSALPDAVAWWRNRVDFLIVEGVGGWKCPLTKTGTVADFAARLGFPVLVVAANRLGVLSHTLLTVESVQSAGLTVAGVVLNNVSSASDLSSDGNLRELRSRLACPVWGPMPYVAVPELQSREGFDTMSWIKLFERGTV